LNTAFLGSGSFSRDLLFNLLRSGFEVSGVITRPDRQAGRGLARRPTPLKALAESENLRVFQPAGPSDPLFESGLEQLRPDVLLVADYGYLLPRDMLEYPPQGCVNVHPSLLPRYRGAAPIQRAIMRGESRTGITLMLMDEGMDTGEILAQEEIGIEDGDHSLALRVKLASLGARMVVEKLPLYVSGDILPFPQDESMASYADPIGKADMKIDWSQPAVDIHNLVRALSPRPGAYTMFRGKRLKILRSKPRQDVEAEAPGSLVRLGDDTILAGTSRGSLQLEELQPEGKKPLGAGDFLHGYRIMPGESLALFPEV